MTGLLPRIAFSCSTLTMMHRALGPRSLFAARLCLPGSIYFFFFILIFFFIVYNCPWYLDRGFCNRWFWFIILNWDTKVEQNFELAKRIPIKIAKIRHQWKKSAKTLQDSNNILTFAPTNRFINIKCNAYEEKSQKMWDFRQKYCKFQTFNVPLHRYGAKTGRVSV